MQSSTTVIGGLRGAWAAVGGGGGTVLASKLNTLCFAAGTLVLTITGLLPIEEVQAGDLVVSLDEETGAWSYERVAQTMVNEAQEVLDLTLEDASGATETLRTTAEHPFWTAERGWTPAAELSPGDRVFQAPDSWLAVASAVWSRERETVYNFEVENTHTYFVGTLGAWVHNNCSNRLLQRMSQVPNVLDPIAKSSRTTAILQTNGPRIVGSGVRDLAPVQRPRRDRRKTPRRACRDYCTPPCASGWTVAGANCYELEHLSGVQSIHHCGRRNYHRSAVGDVGEVELV
jgi:hypothetical protein